MKAGPAWFLNALSWLTGISIAIGLLVTLNQIRIPFFLYYPSTTDTVLISESLDRYMFLGASLCVPGTLLALRNDWRSRFRSDAFAALGVWVGGVLFLAVNVSYGISIVYIAVIMFAITALIRRLETIERRMSVAHLVFGGMTIIAMIECASIYYWVVAAFSPRALFGVASQDLETALTYSAYPAASTLLLVILFSWVWIPLVPWARRNSRNKPLPPVDTPKQSERMSGRLLGASLGLLAILSALIFSYLYAAGPTWIVGVDSIWRYLKPLTSLSGQTFPQAVLASLRIGHGVYVVLLYAVESGTGISSFTIVKFAPLILTFCTSSFALLAFRSMRSNTLALMSAICAILWFPTTLGIFGGIQANWVAYALWMLFLASYLHGSERLRIGRFVAQSLLSVGILIVHPWTWGVFVGTVIVAALPLARHRTDFRRSVTGLLSAVWLAIPIGLVVFIYLPGIRADMANMFFLYSSSLLHPNVMLRFLGAWSEMWREWGSFLSPTLIIIALVGAFALAEVDGGTKRYMLAWVAIWCVGSLLAAHLDYNSARPATSQTQLWRMLYVSPLPFLLALGIKKCVDLSRRLEIPLSGGIRWTQPTLLGIVIGASSLPLFISTVPVIRLIVLISGTVALFLLTFRLRVNSSARIMILIALILIMVNAAFRSLFPLLLYPYNA